MKRRLSATRPAMRTAAAAVILVLFSGVVCGQTPRGTSVLARYAHTRFKPEVLSGRIVGRYLRQGRPQVTVGGERLTVQPVGSAGKMELIYEGLFREGPFRGKKLKVVLDTAGRLEIERGADDESQKSGGKTPSDVYMRFIQQPGEPIFLPWATGPRATGPRAALFRRPRFGNC